MSISEKELARIDAAIKKDRENRLELRKTKNRIRRGKLPRYIAVDSGKPGLVQRIPYGSTRINLGTKRAKHGAGAVLRGPKTIRFRSYLQETKEALGL
jgi:hypothetical protein